VRKEQSDPPEVLAVDHGAARSVGHFRWVICALLFFSTALSYIDRQVFSILAPELQQSIGWSEVEYGYIVSAFHVAYAIGLLGVGRMMDRMGTRRGFPLAIGFWSLATAAHALCRSALGFGVARFALALGEAGNFPAAVKTVAEWFRRRNAPSPQGSSTPGPTSARSRPRCSSRRSRTTGVGGGRS
jgi:MFS transporter, ACS family, hexuronate transporter